MVLIVTARPLEQGMQGNNQNVERNYLIIIIAFYAIYVNIVTLQIALIKTLPVLREALVAHFFKSNIAAQRELLFL